MDARKLNRWLGVATNIGVIIGLVFLAIEIHQNSEMLKLTSSRESTAALQNVTIQQMQPEIAEIIGKAYDNKQLSLSETITLEGFLMSYLFVLQEDFIDYQAGLFPEEKWQTHVPIIRFMFLPDPARLWWLTFREMYVEDFRTLVTTEIEKLPDPIGYSDYFGRKSPVQETE